MADISKRIEKAEKYLQKGKIESALEEYLSALDVDPGNDTIRQTAAELFIQVNRPAEAAALLSEIFDRQIALGDNLKAGVTYKKMSRLVQPKLGQTLRFAQVSERSGNRREALDAYKAAVAGFLSEHRENEALSAMRRIVGLDATQENLQKLADLAARLKDRNAAGEAFLKIGLADEADGKNGFPWFERAHKQDPSNPEIAFRFGKALLDKGDVIQAVKVLEVAKKSDSHVLCETYGLALIAAHKPLDAYPIFSALFDKNPGNVEPIGTLIAELLSGEHYKKAIELARKVAMQQQGQGTLREFVGLLKEATKAHPPDAEFLEFLAELFNSSSREHDYCDALIQLFDLRYAAGQFSRAADALDRAAEVDPYTKGLAQRLDLLRGKIDEHRYGTITSRLQSAKTEAPEPLPEEEEAVEVDNQPTVLEDLMLQAEIFLQYSMRSKALERLERIQKLFPREEEKNDKLRQLYLTAGILPGSADAQPVTAPPAPGPTESTSPPPSLETPLSGEDAVDNFARVTEITRNIHRHSNVKSVLFAAVNDVGRHWNASRCVAGLCSPGKPPSAALEYCAPGVKQSDVMSIVRLIGALQNIAVKRGAVVIEDVTATPELASVKEHLDTLQLKSVLASPLHDGDQQVGILILEQTDKRRKWRSADVVVLKTIADQIVLAVNNAKLRNLMKTLAVTDEKSGLLKRASYIDVMTAEVKRSIHQNAAMTLMLLNFGRISILARGAGESAVEAMMQSIGQSVVASIRQTDTAVRYDRTSIALILGDTKDTNAFFVIDKLRKMIANIKIPGTESPVTMTVGIAGAVIHKDYDPVDIVTEVINRVEQALEVAHSEGPNSAHAMAPIIEAVAVA